MHCAAHRSVSPPSSCVIGLCPSAWRRSSSAAARPWPSSPPAPPLASYGGEAEPGRSSEEFSVPSRCPNPCVGSSLGHGCVSSLAPRPTEQEMNSTHSFPKFPSPPPPPPAQSPPPTLPACALSHSSSLYGREVGSVALMGNEVPAEFQSVFLHFHL